MERTRRIEKLFIQYTDELSANSETLFYQKEFNTYEYYNEENLKDCIEATITNCFAAENYLEQGYKYLNEYLKINNSFAIFGTVKDDPEIKKCVEMVKDMLLRLRSLKVELISLFIMQTNSFSYKPTKIPNETLNLTLLFNNKYKNPKTPEIMVEFAVRSLVNTEMCLSALDHIISYYFDKHSKQILWAEEDDVPALEINNYEESAEALLDAFLDFKLNHFVLLNI